MVNLLQLIGDALFVILGIVLLANKLRKPAPIPVDRPVVLVWHLRIYTIEGETPHEITVLDDEYQALRTWLRGEGDSLFEISTDDAYLGLRRAHVVSVKGEKQ